MSHTADWHPADIKAALQKRGMTMTEVARRHELTDSAVRKAVGNFRPMTRVKALVAAAIGELPQAIWPSLFDEHGHPIPAANRHGKDTRNLQPRNVRGGLHLRPYSRRRAS